MLESLARLRDYGMCALTLGTSVRARWAILWQETKNARVRLHLDTHHPERIYQLQTTYGPLYFRDNFGDITNLVNLLYRRVYRVQELAHEGIILDVGANIGLAAVWFGHHNPGRTIYCFEPLPASAALVALNCPEARIERTAVGASSGRVRLNVDRDGVMASRIPCTWETSEAEFDVVSLDEYAEAERLGDVALMKIDTEGMETLILEGAARTLGKTRQVIVETHSALLHDATIGHLTEAGFHIDSQQFARQAGLVFASR